MKSVPKYFMEKFAEGQFEPKYIERCQSAAQTRGKSWLAFLVITPETVPMSREVMETIVADNHLGNSWFLLAAHEHHIWMLVKFSEHGTQKRLLLPVGFDYDVYSMHRQNQNNTKMVLHAVDTIKASSMILGTMAVEARADGDPSWENIMDFLTDKTSQEWDSIFCNAKLAVTRKAADTMQTAIVVLATKCAEFIERQSLSKDTIVKARSVVASLSDFTGLSTLELLVLDVRARTIVRVPLREYTHGALHMRLFLWVVGASAGGKTTLCRALGQHFSQMTALDSFMLTPGFDLCGLATRDKSLASCSSVFFDDAKLVSQACDVPLNVKDMLSVMSVDNVGGFPCRYTPAVLRRHIARGGTANGGPKGDGSLDYGAHFDTYGFRSIAALARGDSQYFATCCDEDIALARRCAILQVPTIDTLGTPIELLTTDMNDELQKRLARPGFIVCGWKGLRWREVSPVG